MQEEGIIYILTNESMEGYIKIGYTTTSVEQRMAELDKTGVPLPFTCHYAVRVKDAKVIERLLHDAFGDYRVRPNREFFTAAPERVVSALKLAGGIVINIAGKTVENTSNDDTTPAAPREFVESNQNKVRRKPISLYKLGIKDGEELIFTRDSNIKCTVVGEKEVEYNGERFSLSALAHRLSGYAQSTGVNGSWWFEYKGEILWNMRERLENSEQCEI